MSKSFWYALLLITATTLTVHAVRIEAPTKYEAEPQSESMDCGEYDNEINLGDGDLNFNAAGSAGHREFNVGMGHMQLLLDKDKSYSKMEVNVGLGTFHDHRPGGTNGHFTISKEYAGTGSGSLEINVGMGSLDIRND